MPAFDSPSSESSAAVLHGTEFFRTPSRRFPGEFEFVWLDAGRRRIVTASIAFLAPRKAVAAPVHFRETGGGEVAVRLARSVDWLVHTCREHPLGYEWTIEGRSLIWERVHHGVVPEWARDAFARGAAELDSNPACALGPRAPGSASSRSPRHGHGNGRYTRSPAARLATEMKPACCGPMPANSPGTVSTDYLDRFGGVGRLFGREALERLVRAHVCVVGVGGVGSWVVEGLVRSGIGAVSLVDLDDVCVTNINRQLPALEGQIGRPKTTVLAERAHLINPACRITECHDFFTESTAMRLLEPAFDFVVDAIDGMTVKALLIGTARQRGIPVLTVGGAGGRRDPMQIRTGDLGEASNDELLRLVRKKLRRDHGFAHGEQRGRMHFGVRCVWSEESPTYPWSNGTCAAEPEPGSNLKLDCASGFGTAVFVTGAFGLAAAGDVVRLIATGTARGPAV